jgi:hypothetical protein
VSNNIFSAEWFANASMFFDDHLLSRKYQGHRSQRMKSPCRVKSTLRTAVFGNGNNIAKHWLQIRCEEIYHCYLS